MLHESRYESLFKELISMLNISVSKLAKTINVDPSLVSRWINGKRIISLKSNYMELISEYIYQNIKDVYQKKLIMELFAEINPDTELDLNNIKDYIYSLILIHQRNLLNEGKNISCNSRNFSNCSEIQYKQSNKEETSLNLKGSKKSFNIVVPFKQVGSYEIISGYQNVINKISDMLISAKNLSSIPKKPILGTFLSNIHISQETNRIAVNFYDIIIDLLGNGWNIITVGLINHNLSKNKTVKDVLLKILSYENFQINYISKYGIMKYPYEVVIVPGVGAIVCFCSPDGSELSNGFVFKDEEGVEIITQQFKYILDQSTPLIKNYPVDRKIDFMQEIAKCQEKMGNQFIYKDYPRDITVPSHIFKGYLKRTFSKETDFDIHFSCYERKLNNFLSQIEEYKYFELYSKKSFEEYIKKRQYKIYEDSSYKIITVTQDEIIKHIENIVNLLEKYENYNIILLNDIERNNTPEMFFMIKQGWGLFLKLNYNDTNKYIITDNPLKNISNETCMYISESTLVNKSAESFLDFLHELPPSRRDKKNAISWLKAKLDEMHDL